MRPIINSIPNTITLLNLLSGCMAVVSALNGDFSGAFWYVIASAIFDFLDGFAARLLKAHSVIGKELDSLADMVSFGVAPSAVLYGLGLGWFGFVVAAFSALRLARFNVDDRQTTEFIGLPTPANALFFVSVGYIIEANAVAPLAIFFSTNWLLYALTAIFSLLLVCNLRMFSLKMKNYSLKNNLTIYTYLLLSLVALVVFQISALPFIIVTYILISLAKQLRSVSR